MDETHDLAFTGWVSRLARTHTVALSRVARHEGLSPDDALDAVQEALCTFLSVPQSRELADTDDEARRFLSVLVRNAARNMRRRHFRARPHDEAHAVPLASDLPSVDQLIARAEEHVALLGCVQLLGEVQRQVVTLRILEEMSGHEVASVMELRPEQVAMLLHRAKLNLLRCIAA